MLPFHSTLTGIQQTIDDLNGESIQTKYNYLSHDESHKFRMSKINLLIGIKPEDRRNGKETKNCLNDQSLVTILLTISLTKFFTSNSNYLTGIRKFNDSRNGNKGKLHE